MDEFDFSRFVQECTNENTRKEYSTTYNIVCQKNDAVVQHLLDPYNLNNNQDAQPYDYIYEQENILENKDVTLLCQLPEKFSFKETQIILSELPSFNSLSKAPSELKEIQEEDIESQRFNSVMEIYHQIIKPKSVALLNSAKKPKKNSNAIKKMGRIILNNIHQFEKNVEKNQGVEQMLSFLNKRVKDKQRPKDMRDGFNTSHLKALFSNCSEVVTSHNLRVAKKLFGKKMRPQIFNSAQIQSENKLLYLNTLKCAALRFCNKNLAVRLQLSQNR